MISIIITFIVFFITIFFSIMPCNLVDYQVCGPPPLIEPHTEAKPEFWARTSYVGATTTLVVGLVLVTVIVVVIALHRRGKLDDLL